MTDLHQARCEPCEGGIPPLSEGQAADMRQSVPRWNSDGTSIERRLKFQNFAKALEFVNQVGALAESHGHHPDLNLHGWNKLDVRLSTHAIGGLSRNDFILAAHIDDLLAKTSAEDRA